MIVNLVMLTFYVYRSIKLILSRLVYQNICSKGIRQQYVMINFNIYYIKCILLYDFQLNFIYLQKTIVTSIN